MLHGALAMADAVIDTGPLVHLDEISHLHLLLPEFSAIILPEAVIHELSNQSALEFIKQHSDTFFIESVEVQEIFSAKDKHADFRLHLADLAVLVLLKRYTDATAITDDLELRKAIEATGCTVTGTVGILFRARKMGILSAEQLRSAIEKLFDDSSLYLSSAFKSSIISMIA